MRQWFQSLSCSVHEKWHFLFPNSSLGEQIPGEIRALKKFKNFSFKRFGIGEWVLQNNKNKHVENISEVFCHLKSALENKRYDIVIADEILYAIQLGLLSENDVIGLIKNKPKDKELILTGSHKPFQKIFELADLVTEVKKIKHPYDKGMDNCVTYSPFHRSYTDRELQNKCNISYAVLYILARKGTEY